MQDILAPFKASNRHPADKLGEIRSVIRDAQALEKEFKAEVAELMGDRDSILGDEYVAKQRVTERKGGLDEKKINVAFGDEYVNTQLRKPSTTSFTITTTLRAEPVE